MRRFLWMLIFLVLSTYGLPAQVSECLQTSLKQHTSGDCEKKFTQEPVQYSLYDALNEIPEIYCQSIQEAISTLSPGQNLRSIPCIPLLGGLSKSKIFCVEIKNEKYVLRLLDEKKPIERRMSELQAHLIAADLKIAPKLVYHDQTPLVMVMEFVEGRQMTRDDLKDRSFIRKLMQMLRKFHQSCEAKRLLRRPKIDAIGDVYARHLKKGSVYPSCFDDLYRKLKEKFNRLNREFLPSHGDLNPGNILITHDGVFLIDWAEAAIDNPFVDIAWISCFSAAQPDQIQELLSEYLGRDPTESEISETLFLKDLTIYLVATVWMGRQEVRDQQKLDALLNTPLKKASDYIKEGVTTSQVSKKQGLELTVYALGWLKEYIENQAYQTTEPSLSTVPGQQAVRLPSYVENALNTDHHN